MMHGQRNIKLWDKRCWIANK